MAEKSGFTTGVHFPDKDLHDEVTDLSNTKYYSRGVGFVYQEIYKEWKTLKEEKAREAEEGRDG